MREEEQKIILSLKEGDNTAYKFIYDCHYPLLCAIAYEYVKDRFLSETLVDDAIFHLWDIRRSLEITTSLRSYLVRAVRNRCINFLNLEREKKEITFSAMTLADQATLDSFETFEYPLATLLEKELETHLMQAIEQLPDDCRRVFKMSRFEEKSYEQIAAASGISVNTVKYHIKKALSLLNAALAKYWVIAFFCLSFH